MTTTATLEDLAREASICTKCRLAKGRTQVVFGSGHPEADLMFIGEAPGFHEDQQGLPFVGAAGKLLETLLGRIGLARDDVYIANVLKCLRYNALVQLGDGSWERVGRLVRRRYDGTVMSVDSDGRLVPRRLIGWYESPLGDRRVYRMTYRSAKNAGGGRVSVQLTGDHEVLTEQGFVPIERVGRGTRIATGQGLSPLAHDVVCGTVLGDGHLNGASSHLFFAHSAQQREYALFKAELLGELSPRMATLSVAAVSGGARTYPVIHVRTLAHRALGILRRDFYGPKKRVPTWIASRLNERMLAFWFMDDGYTRIRTGRQPLAEIATSGFSDSDLVVLLEALAGMGLLGKALRGRIFFDARTTRLLGEVIAPYVPPVMRYKLHPEVAASTPFDASRFHPEPPKVVYDEVEVEDVTDRERTDRTFFCIDVEETHNFVTAGGVVHNCRPPGNRDPMPDEIESCTPYLMRQIELVNPRVICTLGNFSTQLLLGKKVGISRVRGQRFDYRGRALVPTFHPAALLRGGTGMPQVEQDFALIAQLLATAPAVAVEDSSEQLDLF